MANNLASINIRFFADIKGFSKSMQNANRKMQVLGKQMTSVGKNLSIGLTAPIVAFGASAVSVFSKFEDAMAKVKAIANATDAEFEALSKNAEELGASTRFTASQVAELQLRFSKLGFKPDEILNATEATLQLAQATGEDLAESADVAAATLNRFGLETTETQRVVNVMATAFSSSALDLNKFQESMKTAAPAAKAVGLSLEETTALLGTLATNGIEGSRAGNNLKTSLIKLNKAGLTLKEGLTQVANSQDQLGTASKLVGINAASTFLVLANGTETTKSLKTALDDTGPSAANMAAIMDDTAAGSMAKLRSAIEAVGISFGRVLAPVIRQVADLLASAASKFSSLSEPTKKIIAVVGGLAAALGPVLAGLGFMATSILPAVGAGMSALLGPVGLVIAALTSIGVIIYKNWQPIKGVLVDIANYFIDLYNESTLVRVVVNLIIAQFKTWWDVVRFVFNAALTIIKTFVKQVVSDFKFLGQIIKGALTFDLDTIKAGLKGFRSETKSNMSGLISGLKEDFDKLNTNIKDNIQSVFTNAGKRAKIVLKPEAINTDPVQKKVAAAVNNGLQGTPPGGGGGSTGLARVESSGLAGMLTTQGATDLTTPTGEESAGMSEDLLGSGMTEKLDTFQAKLEQTKQTAQMVGGAVANAFGIMSGKLIESLDLADDGMQGFVKGMVSTIVDLIKQLLAASIAQAVLGAQTSATATGPAAIFTSPAFIASAVGGVLSAFAAIPKFAQGGVVTGETLAMVGDNRNARFDPEIISPLSKLKEFISPNNSGNTNISLGLGTTIKGNDLELIIDRVLTKKQRY